MPLTSVEELIHGAVVRDPFRWLEDRSLPETERWIRGQQRRCDSYLTDCPGFSVIEARVRQYLDIETVDQPTRAANMEFYRKRLRGEEQGSLYVRDLSSGLERRLVDPAGGGKFASVAIYRISEDGKLLAYEAKRDGGDQKEIRFVNVQTGEIFPDWIPSGYAGGLVFAAGGYYYNQAVDGRPHEHTICFHRFGDERKDTTELCLPRSVGSRLVLAGDAQCLGAIWIRPKGAEMVADFFVRPRTKTPTWRRVFAEKQLPYNPILIRGRIFVLTLRESKLRTLVELTPAGDELRTVVPEMVTPIRHLAITADRIFTETLQHGIFAIDVWDFDGHSFGTVDVPQGGTIEILPNYGLLSANVFYTYESFDTPPEIYQFDLLANKSRLWHARSSVVGRRRLILREKEVASSDGALVPVTLAMHTSGLIVPPGPALMTSYGGFGVAATPQFSVFVAILMELGVVFVLPHIRGGSEFGTAWHDAGRRTNRQSAIDDFLVVAEWLSRNRITTPPQLGIFGGSNSGLLVAAALIQRPELFGAVLSIAPLLDMVRYESFGHAARWRTEYGTVASEEDFRALYAYSPYHRVEDETNYPATMFVCGDGDDRCDPAHVRKMAARIQERPAQTYPSIVDYSAERGHSPALPLSVRVRALARRIAFFCRELRIPIPEGGLE